MDQTKFSTMFTFSELSTLLASILEDMKKHYQENNELSDSSLLQLHSVCGDVTEKALLLLENSTFVSITTENESMKLYRVKGSSGIEYFIFPGVNYCECSAYKYQVCKGDPFHLTCKHRLAAQLAEITGKFKEEKVSNSRLVEILLNNHGETGGGSVLL